MVLLESSAFLITESILSKYDEEDGKGRDKLFNYFIKYKLKHMMENIGEF